jgi:hypothetical protein
MLIVIIKIIVFEILQHRSINAYYEEGINNPCVGRNTEEYEMISEDFFTNCLNTLSGLCDLFNATLDLAFSSDEGSYCALYIILYLIIITGWFLLGVVNSIVEFFNAKHGSRFLLLRKFTTLFYILKFNYKNFKKLYICRSIYYIFF